MWVTIRAPDPLAPSRGGRVRVRRVPPHVVGPVSTARALARRGTPTSRVATRHDGIDRGHPSATANVGRLAGVASVSIARSLRAGRRERIATPAGVPAEEHARSMFGLFRAFGWKSVVVRHTRAAPW
jgi:hypothetical protein